MNGEGTMPPDDWASQGQGTGRVGRTHSKTKTANCAYFKRFIVKSKLFSAFSISIAEDVLWSRINDKNGPEKAEWMSRQLMNHHPVLKPLRQRISEHRLEERDDRLLAIRDRRSLRRFVGPAPVEELKHRKKQAKLAYRQAKIASTSLPPGEVRKAQLDFALKQWNEEERAIETDCAILGYGGKDKYDADRIKFRDWCDNGFLAKDQTQHVAQVTETVEWKPAFRAPYSIDNNRNTTLHKMACSLFAKNLSPEAIWAALEAENTRKCYEPLPMKELQQLFRSAMKYHLRNLEKKAVGAKPRFTDTANAERLIEEHGEYIRFVAIIKKWVIYDGTRWLFDAPGGMFPLVRLTNEGLYQYAVTLESDDRTRVLRELPSLESLNRQRAMIDTAATMPAVIIDHAQLDKDRDLVNVNNGTLDTRTGNLRPHDPRDFITKLAPVTFDPSATCPTFEAFLHKIMAGNSELIAFLRRAIGYSLTGHTSEQCFFFLYGNGANGKSTLLNIIRALLGDYAMQAPAEMLMVRNNQGGANNDVARLPGARFVATSETEDGQRFAESALKQMTGQDTIPARFLYGEFFEFVPQYKIFLAANHKPVVRGTDNAIWRRIHLIPFTVTIPEAEQDRHLEAKLIKELSGVLNLALAGCLEWRESGLRPPDEVRAAVKEYRRDMDVFSQWIEECCFQGPVAWGFHKDLYDSYKEWAKENTGWVLSSNKFGRILMERGFIKDHTPSLIWRGIGLLEPKF
jgi:P4 family phage/plasmid primase-like protien